MAQPPPSTKKRKLTSGSGSIGAPTPRKSKHAKTTAGAGASPNQKKQDKGKGKATDSEFTVVKAVMRVSVAPVFAQDLRTGVEEMLDSMLMRYIPALRGVVLSHSNLEFLDSTATLIAECPFAVCKIGFDATMWSPQLRMKLVGKINLCSPDHISLLVHRTFNASIPRHHIPTDEWEFEYGPAENDPEFGNMAGNTQEENMAIDNQEGGSDMRRNTRAPEEGRGRWVHRITGEILGDVNGLLEFTVIGLTVANEMLSLQVSIQHDPFSPVHGPHKLPVSHADPMTDAEEEVRAALVDGPYDEDSLMEDDDDDSGDDTFVQLGRMADEGKERMAAEMKATLDAQLKQKEEKARLKKKRKREKAELEGE